MEYNRIKVLFLCIHNSGRSQMAEAYLKQLGGKKFNVESAGLESGTMNQLVVKVMAEDQIDISKNLTKEVEQFYKEGRRYDYVITVCDDASAERCPVFPGKHSKIHWNFPDPSALTGTEEEKMKSIRVIRDEIKNAIAQFVNQVS